LQPSSGPYDGFAGRQGACKWASGGAMAPPLPGAMLHHGRPPELAPAR